MFQWQFRTANILIALYVQLLIFSFTQNRNTTTSTTITAIFAIPTSFLCTAVTTLHCLYRETFQDHCCRFHRLNAFLPLNQHRQNTLWSNIRTILVEFVSSKDFMSDGTRLQHRKQPILFHNGSNEPIPDIRHAGFMRQFF